MTGTNTDVCDQWSETKSVVSGLLLRSSRAVRQAISLGRLNEKLRREGKNALAQHPELKPAVTMGVAASRFESAMLELEQSAMALETLLEELEMGTSEEADVRF